MVKSSWYFLFLLVVFYPALFSALPPLVDSRLNMLAHSNTLHHPLHTTKHWAITSISQRAQKSLHNNHIKISPNPFILYCRKATRMKLKPVKSRLGLQLNTFVFCIFSNLYLRDNELAQSTPRDPGTTRGIQWDNEHCFYSALTGFLKRKVSFSNKVLVQVREVQPQFCFKRNPFKRPQPY